MLELRDVTKHYTSGVEIVRAVDGVSLTVSGGEFVALYGPSGSGKTTLLLLAAGLTAPDDGAILFDGRDIGVFSERDSATLPAPRRGLCLSVVPPDASYLSARQRHDQAHRRWL